MKKLSLFAFLIGAVLFS
jgi:hypothetical protein